LFLILVGIFAVAGLAALAFRRRPRGRGGVLVVGLLAVFAAALAAAPVAIVSPWAAPIVMTAALVLGWPGGLLAALGIVAILLGETRPSSIAALDPSVANGLLLSLATLLVATLAALPQRRVLGWTWSSYLEALDRTREARERQAELARLSKSLSESYYRLEQLNVELERARQAARKAQQLKAQFAAAVSHELRTPLNLIIGFCEMMVLSPESAYGRRLPPSYRSDVEAIYRNSCHISNLIDDILDLSQIDAGRMALQREWATLRQIVDETVATVETLYRDRELLLRVEIPPDLPPLFVDRTRIRQILINWLANAARFTEQGGVTVRAEARGEALLVAVSDTGPGIAPEEQSLLFEEFSQVGGKRWQKGGSGLGLAVSKRFAELHGGTTWVESTPGRGSTFFLRLPVVAAEDGDVARDGLDWDERIGARVRGQVQPRVLVIDESGHVARILRRYLDGYQVIAAQEYLESRRRREALPPHAVVLGSPDDREGWDSLLAEAPELDGALLVTCPLHTPRRIAEEMGVTDYLIKPVTRKQVEAAIGRLPRPPRHVLVVDDDPEMVRLLGRMVRSLHPACAVTSAGSGQQAIDVLRADRPDLILLDLLMPLVDGYAVLQAARTDPDACAVPVIVVSARGLRDEAIVAGGLSLSRTGGLTVAEVTQWLKIGLEALFPIGHTAPGPRGAPGESPAWSDIPGRPERARESAPAGPST
jgi:signal transduction histidine kinase/DNA-binding response OmpR family regulator